MTVGWCRVSGGSERDYLDGGQGNDILTGGTGDDTIYGMDGDDRISGGEGQDYLEGAKGNDTIDGDAGNDLISGGRGDDTIRGDGGSDKIYTGFGADTADGGSGSDTVFSQADDRVSGTEQQITVQLKDLGKYFKPTFDTLYDGPPVTVLYHEMAHVYDYEYGTLADGDYTGSDNYGVPNKEREAAGLPIDDDGNPNTPNRIDPDHPYDYTENGLRDEMGAPHRPRY